MTDEGRKPTVQRLDSGYWLVKWNQNQWVQWPVGQEPILADSFGWVTHDDLAEAARLTGEAPK
jgi:hypothetical protein